MSGEPQLACGPVDATLAAEFPGLAILSCAAQAPARPSDPGVLERLELLADRFRGRRAVELRREPVPAAYRVFFRQVGLDPDVHRTPVEDAAITRLVQGGHLPAGRLQDALLLALLETGVPVSAFDDSRLDGVPGLRLSRAGERVEAAPHSVVLPAGRIVIADADRVLAELFGAAADAAGPRRSTARLRLVAVQVPGVPAIHVEEALWTCQEALTLA